MTWFGWVTVGVLAFTVTVIPLAKIGAKWSTPEVVGFVINLLLLVGVLGGLLG